MTFDIDWLNFYAAVKQLILTRIIKQLYLIILQVVNHEWDVGQNWNIL